MMTRTANTAAKRLGRVDTHRAALEFLCERDENRKAKLYVPQHSGLKRIPRIGWRMPPPPDKGKCPVTIYPITIYHGP
jgi:hypothetical protein